MPSIAILTAHARFPWLRQIPGGGDSIGDWRFTIGRIDPDCALLVVYDDLAAPVTTTLPKARRLVITSEPPGIKRYRAGFLAQFGTIRGPVGQEIAGTAWQRTQPALPWFYGIGFTPEGLIAHETVDSLRLAPPPAKQAAISVILSKKSQLPKHRARLKLVEYLSQRLGERFHVFGRGFREVSDKAEAIAPFAYHLVLENNDIAHFWTEKTADAYLGWALPIFSGCAELGQYVPEAAFIRTAIENPRAVGDQLEAILAAHPYAERLPSIRRAREAILANENLFPILAAYAAAEAPLPEATPGSPEPLRPNSAFAPLAGLAAMLRATARPWRAPTARHTPKD